MIHGIPRRAPWQWALLLVAALVLALLVTEGLNTGWAPTAAATVASGALCVAALVVPTAWFARAAALAVCWSSALSVLTTQLAHRPANTPGLVELCALLLLTTRTVRVERRLLRTAALVCGSGLATALVPLRMPGDEYRNVGNYLEPALAAGFLLMVVLGLYLRLLDTYRARERAADLQEQRLEHARELHDFVAHHVTAMIAQTKAVRYATAQGSAPDPAGLDVLLAGVEQAGAQAMESMRGMVSVLRSDAPGGTTARPAGDLSALRELTEAATRTGTPARLTLDPALSGPALTPEITTTVHRVVREALTNVRKHGSGVTHVDVDVRLCAADRGRLCVSVTDDGHPATPRGESAGGGYGLVGLTERVQALGGTLVTGPRIQDPAGRGWRVAAELPLPASVTDASVTDDATAAGTATGPGR